MVDYMPVSDNGTLPFTLTVGATAVVGGNLLDINADDTVIPALGALHPIGVAAFDASTGARVTVFPVSGVLHETALFSGVAVLAGAPIAAATAPFAGRASTGALTTLAQAGTLIGVCVRGNTGNSLGGAKVRWLGIA